ncbi:MAG: ABC transporter permease [Firmicutes bacterium]|nr:ABC transporter permease [Bacillota bacterium]
MKALKVVYIIWLREFKTFLRERSRIVGMIGQPLLYLLIVGQGIASGMSLNNAPGGLDYLKFMYPGIIGMSILFTSIFSAVSIIWDREFGFLKEIMVALVSRISIAVGRIAGGISSSLLQGISILLISLLLGFKIKGFFPFVFSIIFMTLVSATFVAIGLGIASQMKDVHGFSLIINFLIFPFFFLSGALCPIQNLPEIVRALSYIDPLTYGVDGLRRLLVGASHFSLFFNVLAISVFSLLTIIISAYLFERSEAI